MSHIQNFWNDKRTSNSNSVSKCCGGKGIKRNVTYTEFLERQKDKQQ